jgi:hypothetical protein
METNELIGSIGVVLMLAAFLLNLLDKLDNDNIFYIVFNFVGGTLACISSILINFTPFIILEGTWALMSGWAIYDYVKHMKIKQIEKSLKKDEKKLDTDEIS